MRLAVILIPGFLLSPLAAPATTLPAEVPAPPAVMAKITADRVNLRAAADTNAEVVAQANYGEMLEALEVREQWVKVRPPSAVLFWVHSELVRDGKVATKSINVRSGSSVNYAVMGQLLRNEAVQVVTNRMEWLGIKPPPTTGVWVYREYVELPPPPAPPPPPVVIVEAPKPLPPPAPAVTRVGPPSPPPAPPAPPPPPPPSDLKLVPLAGQGTLSTRTGVLRAYLLTAGKPSRFRLTLEASAGIEQAVCMVKADDRMLKPWVGRKIVLRGRDYWVQGEKLPVTVPEDIQESGN